MRRISYRAVARIGPLLILGALAALTNSSAAGASSTAPSVTLIGPATLTEDLHAVGKSFVADFTLSIQNDGSEAIQPGAYKFVVVSDRNYTNPSQLPTIKAASETMVKATDITPVSVRLTVHDLDTTSLTAVLKVTRPTGVPPSTVALTLTRSPKASNFVAILGASLGLGILVFATLIIKEGTWRGDGATIYSDSTFSFNESFVTSIAAVLAIIATVFSATGVLTSLVPGIDTDFFLGVTVVFGVVITLAPLVYSIFQIPANGPVYGRRIGFVIAATIVGISVGGQLATLGAIVAISNLGPNLRITFCVLLGVVALIVLAYIRATENQLWALRPPGSGKQPAHVAALV
jgi:hypothetical protein